MRVPKRPSASPLVPAVKNKVLVGPAPAPLPNARPHRPSILIGLPLASGKLAGGCESVRATLRELEGIDPAVAEVSDQQVATELPEVAGCHGNAPGRVERPSRRDPLEQVAAGVEDVNEAETLACDVIVLGGVLLGVGDEQETLRGARQRESLDPEGSESLGELGIGECARGESHLLERAVEHVNLAGVEVRGEQEVGSTTVRQCQALVNRAGAAVWIGLGRVVNLQDRGIETCGAAGIPAGDRTVLSGEDEIRPERSGRPGTRTYCR